MALQKTVNILPAVGLDGQEVVIGQAVYAGFNAVSDGTVKPGAFAFIGKSTGDGVDRGVLSGTSSDSSAKPVGFVERVVDASIITATDSVSETYPEGFNVTVALRGQYYITAPSAISDGQLVLVDPSTGEISAGSAAAGSAIDTGWIFRVPNGGTTAVQGDVVYIENFG